MTKATTTDPDQHPPSAFLAKLGGCLVMWNIAERAVRLLLASLARDSLHIIDPRGDILTMELGSRQLTDALRSFAHETLRGEHAQAVHHVASYFDALLPYRNYYIHGVVAVGPSTSPPGEAGVIQSLSAKGKLMQDNEWLTAPQLDQFSQWAGQLSHYATAVTFHMYFPSEPRPPLPETPPLPLKLVKRRLSLRELRHSSE